MHLMTFGATERQLLLGMKTVTRRKGWEWLVGACEAGARPRLAAVRRRFLAREEVAHRLAEIEVEAARREPLSIADDAEATLEGFPGMSGETFVRFAARVIGASPSTIITRIQFRLVEIVDAEALRRAERAQQKLIALGRQQPLFGGL